MAARRLLVERGYGQVTMQEVAQEAGVAYQTVYAQFGTKTRLAMEVCDADLAHVGDALALVGQASGDEDPATWLRVMGTVARRLYEPCADLLRFMRESGDPGLVGRFKDIERSRLGLVDRLGPRLARTAGRAQKLSGAEAVDVVWTLAGPEPYEQLVLDRGWTPDRYERWLGDALVDIIVGAGRVDGSQE